MLNKLTNMKFSPFKRSNLGLYRDDGLAVVKVRGRPGSILEGLSKKVIEIFKKVVFVGMRAMEEQDHSNFIGM